MMVFPSYLDQLSLSHQHAGKFPLDYWLHCHEPVTNNSNLLLWETCFINREKTFTTSMETTVTEHKETWMYIMYTHVRWCLFQLHCKLEEEPTILFHILTWLFGSPRSLQMCGTNFEIVRDDGPNLNKTASTIFSPKTTI